MERQKYLLNFLGYAEDIKRILAGHLLEFEVYVFGFVLKDFSPSLSDIDIAIVSDEFESREKKYSLRSAL